MNGRIADGAGLGRALLSIMVGLLLAAIIIYFSGYNVRDAMSALWVGSTGLRTSPSPNRSQDIPFHVGNIAVYLNKYNLAQSLARVTPLLLTGLSVAVGLRGGLFNIGAQGQMVVGAVAAAWAGQWTGLPTVVHVPLALAAGMTAGAAWGAIPGLLKSRRGVHEVISTIMLNYVAANVAKYLIGHAMKDPESQAAQTAQTLPSSWLTPFIPGANLTAGLLLALVAAILVSFLVIRTASGFEIRAVGQGADAARANGIAVNQVVLRTMLISGALAGLAGAIEIAGVQHRYFDTAAGNYGFEGIAVALLGGLGGWGVALSALFFGMLAGGAAHMSLVTDVPDAIAVIVQAVVILFVGVRVARKSALEKLRAAITDTDERPEDAA